MRVLAYIHTFNDANVIDGTVAAVCRQTRPPDAILIVDNASTDGTLNRAFPEKVGVIRNAANFGTSGAVGIGFEHALEKGFDWIWILDADSVPEPEALGRLLDLYSGWPESLKEETGFIACLALDQSDGRTLHGRRFTQHGRSLITPGPEESFYSCNVTIWSGCLYRLAAVRRVGFPNPDYVLDRGELEYAYRVMMSGHKAFIHQDAVIRHQIRGVASLNKKTLKFGPVNLTVYDLAPVRCYYVCRNTLYFTLYDLAGGSLAKFRELWRVRSRPGRSFMSGVAWQAALFTMNFMLRPRTRRAQIRACLRGMWHGVTGNITARY